MDDKKKKYVIPEVEVVTFKDNDIITESLTVDGVAGWDNGTGEDY